MNISLIGIHPRSLNDFDFSSGNYRITTPFAAARQGSPGAPGNTRRCSRGSNAAAQEVPPRASGHTRRSSRGSIAAEQPGPSGASVISHSFVCLRFKRCRARRPAKGVQTLLSNKPAKGVRSCASVHLRFKCCRASRPAKGESSDTPVFSRSNCCRTTSPPPRASRQTLRVREVQKSQSKQASQGRHVRHRRVRCWMPGAPEAQMLQGRNLGKRKLKML